MCLIENQNTVRRIVELAQFSAPIGIDGFKKLHGSRNNDLCIPIFRRGLELYAVVWSS